MTDKASEIDPQKVTKPIQLLAAWLVGLISVNSIFLFTATKLANDGWASKFLVVAAIVNVPIFLGAIFLLQTKYRPELQEDSFYSQYLDKKSNKIVTVDNSVLFETEITKKIEQIQNSVSSLIDNQTSSSEIELPFFSWSRWHVAVNDLHPQFNTIVRSLTDAKIPINDYFGSSSVNSQPPEKYLIAFRNGMDHLSCLLVLRYIIELGFEGYYYFEEDRAIDPEDVYLGAYGYPSTFIPINNELIALTKKKHISSAELRNFEKQYA